MDVLREINYAEKAGSGFDKIFLSLLTKGKELPQPTQTDHSVVFRIEAETYAEKLVELSLLYRSLRRREIDLETILVLNAIYTGSKRTFKELAESPFINESQLRRILDELQDMEFIEATGRTSGQRYIIHKSKLADTQDEVNYLRLKKQEKARQIEAIMRYFDEFDEIDNQKAQVHLNLPDNQASHVSRLFADMVDKNLIYLHNETGHHQRVYRRKNG